MPVIAALHYPSTILVANNLADVVPPDDDSANGRTTSIYAVVSPRAREVVLRARIAAHLIAHVPPAPCSGTPSVGAAVMRRGSCFCARRESEKQCHRRNDFAHTAVLLFAWDWLLSGDVPRDAATAICRRAVVAHLSAGRPRCNLRLTLSLMSGWKVKAGTRGGFHGLPARSLASRGTSRLRRAAVCVKGRIRNCRFARTKTALTDLALSGRYELDERRVQQGSCHHEAADCVKSANRHLLTLSLSQLFWSLSSLR